MPLQLDIGAEHGRLELRRPPSNILDPELLAAVLAALDELEARGAPPLLLSAQGRHFSTGYSIDSIPEEIFHGDPAKRSASLFERVMERLAAYPAPVLAALQGDAYGGAVELLCCTDLRIGVRGLRVAVPSVRLGLVYSLGGLRRFVWAFGASLATELILTGEAIGARRLLRAGFLHRLVAPANLEATATAMLESLGRGAPLARSGSRRALRALAEAETLPPALRTQIDRLRHESWLSEDFREAQRAFLEKRRPRFQGR